MTIQPLGDAAVVITLGDVVDEAVAARVRAIASEIERHPPTGVLDVVSAFSSVAVFYDPSRFASFAALLADLEALVARADAAVVSQSVRSVAVPVCYGHEYGPDIDAVATHHHLSTSEVIARHAAGDYVVHAIGFAPGFPYLGGLPAGLATPRRATPRSRVPPGSVGIGGQQTGIYPLETPGGWNLIGRTPLRLFDPQREEPALLRAGDRVTFEPISAADFVTAMQPLAKAEPASNGSSSGAARGGLEVVRAGMFTTVQDLGRRTHRARGVPLGGAADAFALRVANLLVGSPEDCAGLEFTLVGPEVIFHVDTVIALGGAAMGGPPRWRPHVVAAGTRLKLGVSRGGCRGYLAVAGGIAVEPVLGSRSTYVRGRFGGHEGRVLRDGDVLPLSPASRHIGEHWWIDERILPAYSASPVVRVIDGVHANQFDAAGLQARFRVSTQSDRMGVRLMGPALKRHPTRDLISLPVAPGTIQVPPDGQPIVLLADAQTIGGYPQVAHVASVDLPLMAQLRPGDSVQFRRITLAEAHELNAAQERMLALLREGLAQKLGGGAMRDARCGIRDAR